MLQRHPVVVVQQVRSVHRHLANSTNALEASGCSGLIPLGTGQPVTLKESLWTSTRISKAEPAVKGLRRSTSSGPQRWFCSVLHTTQGDLRKRGLKWNATSALGWMLLPQLKSTWNLEDKPEEPLGQVLPTSLKVDVCRSPVGLG